MQYFFAICTAATLAANVGAINAAPSGTGGTESLGGQLLDELSPGVVPLPAVPPVNESNKLPATPKKGTGPAKSRFDDLGDDIGQPSGQKSLVRVRQTMQQATAYLGDPALGARPGGAEQAGAAQKQVVAQLDNLIAELSKQCQCQGGQGKPGEKPPTPGQRSQSKPGSNSGSTAGRGRTAARDSTDRLDRASAQPVDKGDIDELVKDLWGHLPERSREQMLQSFSDEFLPKYEFEIEQYYRRLSEEELRQPGK